MALVTAAAALATLLVVLPGHGVHGFSVPIKPAAQYIPLNERQTLVFLEAENFTVAPSSIAAFDGASASTRSQPVWQSRAWAHSPNYYASTVANVFHSRRAYLHHPAVANRTASADPAAAMEGSTAAAAFHIPARGEYSVLIRYEAPYRFEVPFQVVITQAGKTVFKEVFGRRTTPKVWGFQAGRQRGEYRGCGPGLNTECSWPYGSTENMVWEFHAAPHALAPGPAQISFTPVRDTDYCCWGDINVDAVMLHPNATDIAERINDPATRDLPFDGMFSQRNEVFFRIRNLNTTTNLSVGVPLWAPGVGAEPFSYPRKKYSSYFLLTWVGQDAFLCSNTRSD